MADQKTLGAISALSSFGTVAKLESSVGWNKWLREISDHLTMNGYGDLFTRNKFEPAQEGLTPSEWDAKRERWQDKQERACGIVRSRLGFNAREEVKDEVTLLNVVETLRKRFRPTGSAVFQDIDQRYQSLALDNCTSVSNFAERLREARTGLLELDESCKIGDPHFVNKLLTGLGPAFDVFLTSFYQNHSLLPERGSDGAIIKHAVTFEEALMAAEREEQAQRIRDECKTALLAKAHPSVPRCDYCGRQRHTKDQCFELHPNLKRAHQAKRKELAKGRQRKRASQKKTHDAKQAETSAAQATSPIAGFANAWESDAESTAPGLMYMSVHSSLKVRAHKAKQLGDRLASVYLLDSGCSQHSGCKREDFADLVPYRGRPLKGIGGKLLQPQGIGTLKLNCNSRGRKVQLLLKDALFCPDMGANLISVSQILRRGSRLTMTWTKAEFLGSQPLTARQEGGLFLLDLWEEPVQHGLLFRKDGLHGTKGETIPVQPPTPRPRTDRTYKLSDPNMLLWHDRMGHLGEQNLRKLAHMSHGMRPIKEGCLCEPCALGRMREVPHKTSMERGKYPLELIHTDIGGPFSMPGHDGSKYWVTFIDDYTQYAFAEPIEHKSDFFGCLRNFLEQLERPERRCHRIRLDRAGENRDGGFRAFCADRGIKVEESGTEQHQQNGVAEVYNRILLDKITPTLIRSGLHPKWWPEILRAVVILRNLSPSSVIDTTPYEAWFGDKPDLSFVRVLGSDGIARIPDNRNGRRARKIFDAKGVRCKLLGFEGSRNYIVVTKDGTIMRTPNVVFTEKRYHHEGLEQLTTPLEEASEHPSAPPPQHGRASLPQHGGVSLPQHGVPLANGGGDWEAGADPPAYPLPSGTPSHSASPNSARSFNQPPDGVRPDGSAENDVIRVHMPQRLDRGPREATEVRRSRRVRNLPSLSDAEPSAHFALMCGFLGTAMHALSNLEPFEPKSLAQARQDYSWPKWKEAMDGEHRSLMDNRTWTLVPPPISRRVLRGKWVYKLKRGPDGEVLRYKARWVVRGFEQQEGVDYNETFASVVKPMSYKALFAIAAALDLELEQMDVKTAFLYGTVEEEIYVEQPPEFHDGSNHVCKLRKALYGLKQSPRIWYHTLALFLKDLGFTPLSSDLGIFVKDNVYIAVYVDDLLIAGASSENIGKLKEALNSRFEMSDLGPCSYYLGMSIKRDRSKRAIHLSQHGYLEKVLKDFGMWESKPVLTPMQEKMEPAPEAFQSTEVAKTWYAKAIGSLMYAMLGTRPDIAFAVSACSRYASNPTEAHIKAVKRIMRYLRGTIDLALVYKGSLKPLVGYTDSDWAGDLGTRRSTGGYVFNIGSGAISWSSKRQATVALSSCEAEYMGQTQATKEAIWLQALLRELQAREDLTTTVIYGDNQGAIALAKNPQFHPRTKHIGIQHHYVREKQASGEIDLQYIPTEKQVADGLTKALPKDRFEQFREALGLEWARTR